LARRKKKRSTINSKTALLKKERFTFYKASQYRASWRERCKKANGNLDDIPSRAVIEKWLDNKEPWICYLTKAVLNKDTFQADHIQPISRGGSFKLSNIGLTSKKYNLAKGNMTKREFKSLLTCIKKWEDGGEGLLGRLIAGSTVFGRRKRR